MRGHGVLCLRRDFEGFREKDLLRCYRTYKLEIPPNSEDIPMTDAEKVAALIAILTKHDDAVNDDEGGERPFNEEGEVIEALWTLVNDDEERLIKIGWLANGEEEK